MRDSYLALLGRPEARRLLGALAAGWLSFGMVGLALFLSVASASQPDLAGVAVGAFALGSAAFAPLRGRLIDRRGLRPWLLVLAGGYAGSLLLLVVSVHVAPWGWLLVLCAATAGASAPPLVASIRGLWSGTVETAQLRRAYALTSLLGDLGLVVAPALGGVVFVLAHWSPLTVCALAALFAARVASGARSPTACPAFPPRSRSPLASGPLRTLLTVEVALGAALGLVQVAILVAATRWHLAAYSGFLLGAFALGSIVGGLWFGRRRWRRAPEQRYLFAVLVLACALAPCVAASSAATLAPLLVVAGLGYGPATISLFEALDVLAPARGTEAFTWVTTAGALGTAGGASASGWASGHIHTQAPFAIAALVLAVAATAALACRRPRLQHPR